MRKQYHISLALFLGLLFLSCNGGLKKGQNGDKAPEALYNHWVHSHEEDTEEAKVYRPGSYEFPPSRGREGFQVLEDGTFLYHAIAPADGNITKKGIWKWEDGKLKAYMDEGKEPEMAMEVMEVEEGVLKVRQ